MNACASQELPGGGDKSLNVRYLFFRRQRRRHVRAFGPVAGAHQFPVVRAKRSASGTVSVPLSRTSERAHCIRLLSELQRKSPGV